MNDSLTVYTQTSELYPSMHHFIIVAHTLNRMLPERVAVHHDAHLRTGRGEVCILLECFPGRICFLGKQRRHPYPCEVFLWFFRSRSRSPTRIFLELFPPDVFFHGVYIRRGRSASRVPQLPKRLHQTSTRCPASCRLRPTLLKSVWGVSSCRMPMQIAGAPSLCTLPSLRCTLKSETQNLRAP
jgi:hypothetical protein